MNDTSAYVIRQVQSVECVLVSKRDTVDTGYSIRIEQLASGSTCDTHEGGKRFSTGQFVGTVFLTIVGTLLILGVLILLWRRCRRQKGKRLPEVIPTNENLDGNNP